MDGTSSSDYTHMDAIDELVSWAENNHYLQTTALMIKNAVVQINQLEQENKNLKTRLATLEGLVKDFAHLVTYRPHYTKAKTEEIYFAKAEDILARPLVRELMEIKP
jgi:hypothetical protein